jgi:hypothetical protein
MRFPLFIHHIFSSWKFNTSNILNFLLSKDISNPHHDFAFKLGLNIRNHEGNMKKRLFLLLLSWTRISNLVRTTFTWQMHQFAPCSWMGTNSFSNFLQISSTLMWWNIWKWWPKALV